MKNDFQKVDYLQCQAQYDESVRERLYSSPADIDLDAMRALIYGYTFTPDYARGIIPDELSMDYWSERVGEIVSDTDSGTAEFLDGLDDVFVEGSDDSDTADDAQDIDTEDYDVEDFDPDDFDPEDFDVEDFNDDCEDDDDEGCFTFYISDSPQEKCLLEAIDSTGDGRTPETALCVIDVHQEYEYIRRVFPYYGLTIKSQHLLEGGIDCIEFEDNFLDVKHLYFDISRRFKVGYKFDK